MSLPGNMNTAIRVHPEPKSESSPIDWATANVMPWTTIPTDRISGNASVAGTKEKPFRLGMRKHVASDGVFHASLT